MKNIKIKLVVFVVFSIGLSSCLKDEKVNNQEYGLINLDANKILEFSEAKIQTALPLQDKDTIINVPVHLASNGPANEDVNVEVSMANSSQAIADYNAENGTTYEALPSNLYSLEGGLNIMVSKGLNNGNIKVKTNTINFNPSKTYAIGFDINKVVNSGYTISGNYKSTIFVVSAKNKYDGKYRYKASDNTSLQPGKSANVTLETVGANKVQLMPGLLATYPNTVFYTIDPVTNLITVECSSLGVQTPQDTRSKYNPTTKVLTVFWKQGNGNRTFEETFTYSGSR